MQNRATLERQVRRPERRSRVFPSLEASRGRLAWGLLAAAVALAVTGPSASHHAFSAEFDADKPLQLKGTVVKTEWINPHTWFHIEVKEPAEYAGVWAIEGGTPNTLYRRGVTKKSVTPGLVIVVDGYRAKDGTLKANGRDMTLPDGRKLFVGSSGTGAPRDGRDPTEPFRD